LFLPYLLEAGIYECAKGFDGQGCVHNICRLHVESWTCCIVTVII